MSKSTITIQTTSPEQTEQLGMTIGSRLRGGEVIELASDLGGGKTTFTKGLVAGLESPDHVSSPTFTISKSYAGGRVPVYHFDLYRLLEAGIISEELAEAVEDERAVTIVEWADIVAGVLPEQRLHITFMVIDETSRSITIQSPASMKYLAEGL